MAAGGEVAERELLLVERRDAQVLQEALNTKGEAAQRRSAEVREAWMRVLKDVEDLVTGSEAQDLLTRASAERSLRG